MLMPSHHAKPQRGCAVSLLTTIKGCALFQGLDDAQLAVLLPLCSATMVAKDALLFQEGDPARFLYIVAQGKVALEMAVCKPDGSLARPATIAVLGPGDAFGWSSLVEPHVFTLSARALEQCQVVCLEGKKVREALEKAYDVGYLVMKNLTRLLAERLAETRGALIYERGWAMVA